MKFKQPKIEKIYEAISAILDDRINYVDENSAHVYSSDRSKFYTLAWNDGLDVFYSDDNASKWQNTTGYPILAILIDKGALKLQTDHYPFLKGVEWNVLNKKFKRDYSAVVAHVLNESSMDTETSEKLTLDVESAFKELGNLDISKSTKKDIGD